MLRITKMIALDRAYANLSLAIHTLAMDELDFLYCMVNVSHCAANIVLYIGVMYRQYMANVWVRPCGTRSCNIVTAWLRNG